MGSPRNVALDYLRPANTVHIEATAIQCGIACNADVLNERLRIAVIITIGTEPAIVTVYLPHESAITCPLRNAVGRDIDATLCLAELESAVFFPMCC
jgi:hypothetical protein